MSIDDTRDVVTIMGPELTEPEETPAPDIYELDKLYSWVRRILPIVQGANKKFIEIFGEKAPYKPFYEYTIESYLSEVYKTAVKAVLVEANKKYPNVPLHTEDIVNHFWQGSINFGVKPVIDYLQEEYFDNAQEMSIKNIHYKSRALLPWGSRKTEMPVNEIAESFRKGKKLVLHHSSFYENFYDTAESLDYFEKLCIVMLQCFDPVTVKSALWISNKKPEHNTGELWERRYLSGCIIKSFKWHKNGNLYVWFETEEQAITMAKHLADKEFPKLGSGVPYTEDLKTSTPISDSPGE